MPSAGIPTKKIPLPEWGREIDQAAGDLGLRRSNLSAAMATEMGIPFTEEPDQPAVVMILWNTERRPIFAYRTGGQAVAFSAKVLQPAIQFGRGAEVTDDKIESMLRLVQGIAFMAGEDRVAVVRRSNDIEAMRMLDNPGFRDAQLVTTTLQDLITVQNVFRQWLDGELTDPIMDMIAFNYALSKTP